MRLATTIYLPACTRGQTPSASRNDSGDLRVWGRGARRSDGRARGSPYVDDRPAQRLVHDDLDAPSRHAAAFERARQRGFAARRPGRDRDDPARAPARHEVPRELIDGAARRTGDRSVVLEADAPAQLRKVA